MLSVPDETAALLEVHPHAAPRQIVRVEVRAMVEEPAAFTDEVHRVLRVMTELDAKMAAAGRRPRVAARDVPPRRKAAEDQPVAEVLVHLDIDEQRVLIERVLLEQERQTVANVAADPPARI